MGVATSEFRQPFSPNHALGVLRMTNAELLNAAAAHAIRYLETLESRPVGATASLAELRVGLTRPFPETGEDPARVIEDLVRDAEPGLLSSAGGRFFGWVVGGALPTALAADWLTSTWDQNAATNATAPAEAVVEEIAGAWAREMLGLPSGASFAFVTGSQMGHVTALAAARHRLLRDRGWDVEAKGLAGAPPIRILATEGRHESLLRAARLVGLGTGAITYVASDTVGRMDVAAATEALRQCAEIATIVWLQAGELHTGAFDRFAALCPLAKSADAWVHVDGAFGLWAAASPKHRYLLEGADQADSWVTDGHKWLNLPYDSGLVFVADSLAHQGSFAQTTSYAVPVDGFRNQKDWNPEWSRRGRGFAAYAALRALGRAGVADIVERCCAHADRLVNSLGALPGAEVVASPVINQGLVRFLAADGDHDHRTDAIVARVQEQGEAWFGGATWGGKRVMRVSVCNWSTSDRDIARAIAAVREAVVDCTR